MYDISDTTARKSDHIRINLNEDVNSGITTGLENYHFIHQALPEIDFDEIDTRITIFNKNIRCPVLISSMTGGTAEASRINRVLAESAQETQLAMGIGSQRAALEESGFSDTFRIRKYAPDVLLFANLGAVQLNYQFGLDLCQKAVDMIEADALILHLNPLQEALQPEGNTRFSGLVKKIESICKNLPVPVIVKEVGWGISAKCARILTDAGVSAIDVAGAGGTSWSQVEMYRNPDPNLAEVAAAFKSWGIPTAQSIEMIKATVPDVIIFASGGLRNGVDIAKCIALGASIGGMARPFLQVADQSLEQTVRKIHEISKQIQIAMFCAGARDIKTLQNTKLSGLEKNEIFK